MSSIAQEVPGSLVPSSNLNPTVTGSGTTCDGRNYYTTCSDCTTVLSCIGPSSDARSCQSVSPGKPFCDDGTCSANRPINGNCQISSFTCTSAGYFPDPSNCGIYHYCGQALEPASTYQCPPKYVYNAASHMCRQRTQNSNCVTVKCNRNALFVPYGNSKTYFAYCQYDDAANSVINVFMFKCVDYATFDGSGCVFICPTQGSFAHPDPRKYYQCYYSQSKLVYSVKQCSKGKVFDNSSKVCVTPVTPY
nr:uncharacterized protein LOC109406557 [Aedes albopictus]